jgi:hypothetical protein
MGDKATIVLNGGQYPDGGRTRSQNNYDGGMQHHLLKLIVRQFHDGSQSVRSKQIFVASLHLGGGIWYLMFIIQTMTPNRLHSYIHKIKKINQTLKN